MVKSMVFHTLDYNWLAPCEEWYYQRHAPQIARRYGPWLTRFESYRPAPFPAGHTPEDYGYTNWFCTVGYWRDIPEEGPRGEQVLTTPPYPAVNYSCFLPPQAEDDFKGAVTAPEERACLRWVIFLQYPEGVDRAEADAFFRDTFAPEACGQRGLYRFFSSRALEEEIHLPGGWKPETEARLKALGSPSNHRWDRMLELWYETYEDWADSVVNRPPAYTPPPWAEHPCFPFLKPYTHMVSTLLLERPAFDWLRECQVWR